MDTDKKAMALRELNSDLIQEIEAMGGQVDITIARIEHFINSLVESGVITNEQRWEEQKAWELRLKHQLVPIRNQMKEALLAAQQKQRQEKLQKKIWTP